VEAPKKRNPLDPIYFLGQITHDSIGNLIDQIRARTPYESERPLEVILTSVGGLNSAARGFMSWMSRFERRNNVRVIASGDVASAAITVFLAFERRSADPGAVFRFHLLAPEKASNDASVAVYIQEVKEEMVRLWASRTKLSKKTIETCMEERLPMSGEFLFRSGICNESPTSSL
jgi:ATP-dependent protease ClpP protease subunit